MTTQHLMGIQHTGVRKVDHSLPYQSWFRGHILAWHETEAEAWRIVKQAQGIRETDEKLRALGLLPEGKDDG